MLVDRFSILVLSNAVIFLTGFKEMALDRQSEVMSRCSMSR
jgi:hypothetical protein